MSTPTPGNSRNNKSSDNLVSLYSRIPDYSEVKHLGHSDFINTLEKLKEEFRQCRASLYTDDYVGGGNGSSSSDIDFITERTSKVLNIDSTSLERGSRNQYEGKFMKIANANLSSFDNQGVGSDNSNRHNVYKDYLSVKGCELHRSPFASAEANSLNYNLHYNKPSRALSFNLEAKNNPGTDSAFHEDEFYVDEISSGAATPNSDISKWSSSPDLYYRPYVPPANIEKRLLQRRSQNNSAPSLVIQDEEKPQMFKANPVPSHVYKPLYDFIMLKNQRRSLKVREQSKQKLMAQVKPFSFTKDSKSANTQGHKSSNIERATFSKEILNNTKPIKSRRSIGTATLKTVNYFRANPAPPRTKALMAAMRLKEQQEYRELKKRLRAEALLKNATLPPSMAARDKRLKLTNAKLDSLIQEYQNSYNSSKDKDNNTGHNYRESSPDDTAYTDDDRASEDSYRTSSATVKPFVPNRKTKNFTPYGNSRHSSAANGVFECTSNDNLASRLRIQATRKRETERVRREEEELLKLMRNENRRKKLRDSHLQAWRRAHSYSSNQDIAMRRQLRMAASILERESFVKEMSNMLTRVRSAPLLLEGVRERRFEPCKKHKEECLQLTDRSNNKPGTPRFILPSSRHGGNWMYDRFGDEKSENAMAEGSLTNSDNECVGNIAYDSEEDKDQENTRVNETEAIANEHQNGSDNSDSSGEEDNDEINPNK